MATTDRHGFFRVPGLTPGACILDVDLPDRQDFAARLALLPHRKTQFLELDYSRIVPPGDDEQWRASGVDADMRQTMKRVYRNGARVAFGRMRYSEVL